MCDDRYPNGNLRWECDDNPNELCPKCAAKLEPVTPEQDILRCPTCEVYYDTQNKMLCGACFTYADRPDGWCQECKVEIDERAAMLDINGPF